MRRTAWYGKRYDLNTPITAIYVLVACMACWTVAYLTSIGFPIQEETITMPLWKAICGLLPNKTVAYAIGFVLMLGGAFLLSRANYALALIREKTLLPFLLYLLYISTDPDFFPLKSTSIGSFCLIISIYLLFTSYHDEQSVGKAFKAALVIGISSLLWVHILWFLPLFWWGMYDLKSGTPKTYAASVFGLLTVYWFVFGWCVWQGDYSALVIPFTKVIDFQLFAFENTHWIDWMGVLLIGIVSIASAVNILTHEYEDSLRTRQYLSFLILFGLFAFLLFLFCEKSAEELLQTTCLSAAILIAHFFTVKRNKYTFWLFHFMVASCIILFFIRIWNIL